MTAPLPADDAASAGVGLSSLHSAPHRNWPLPAFGIAVASVAATAVVLWTDLLPLGIVGEWTWPRVPFSIESAIAWGTAMLGFALYLAVAWKGDQTLATGRSRRQRAVWLIVLFAAGALWWNLLLFSMPTALGYGRVPFVLYYARSSGYFLQARDEIDNLRLFLRDYEELLAEEDYLHIGTHPPGLTASLRLLLESCRRSSVLRSALLATEPGVVREAIHEVRANQAGGASSLDVADEACLWGAALLVQLVFLLGGMFLYALVSMDYPPSSAWRVAALWPLIPGAIVFYPKSDLLFPTLALACTCFWFHGIRRPSVISCMAAGFVAWAGMMLSLALAPTLVLLAVATLWLRPWRSVVDSPSVATSVIKRLLVPIAWGAAGFLVPVLVLWAWSGLNLFSVWSWNLHNHALFYEHNTRTWSGWLLVNPIEFAMTLGLPMALFAVVGMWRHAEPSPTPRVSTSLLVAWCLVMAALLLTGKNMGEVARLWLVFTPWPMLALSRSVTPTVSDRPPGDASRTVWIVLLVAQAVCCVLTVTRVDGFQFAELMGS